MEGAEIPASSERPPGTVKSPSSDDPGWGVEDADTFLGEFGIPGLEEEEVGAWLFGGSEGGLVR